MIYDVKIIPLSRQRVSKGVLDGQYSLVWEMPKVRFRDVRTSAATAIGRLGCGSTLFRARTRQVFDGRIPVVAVGLVAPGRARTARLGLPEVDRKIPQSERDGLGDVSGGGAGAAPIARGVGRPAARTASIRPGREAARTDRVLSGSRSRQVGTRGGLIRDCELVELCIDGSCRG